MAENGEEICLFERWWWWGEGEGACRRGHVMGGRAREEIYVVGRWCTVGVRQLL